MLDARPSAIKAEPRSAGQTAPLDPPTFEIALEDRTKTLTRAIEKAQSHLLSLQHEDGHWCGELEGATILESEYLMLLCYLGLANDPRFALGCRYLRTKQLEEGGWSIFPGGPPEVSASVKAYLILKLFGDDPDAHHMIRARESVRRMGGLAACNSFTKLYLAIFGLWRWDDAPAVPPELILLPRWFYFNIYEISSWSRAIVVPLAMIWALKPLRKMEIDLGELEVEKTLMRQGGDIRERFLFACFRAVDDAIKAGESLRLFRPVRELALRRCEEWTRERLERSAGLAGIFPAIMNSIIALESRGVDRHDPVIQAQLEELEKLEIVEGEPGFEALRLQPCCSPIWDTALSMNALLASGVDRRDARLQTAAGWLLDKEVRGGGDWQVKNPDVEPGGWYFEYANEFYPDCDDTGEILGVLARVELDDPDDEARRKGALRRALCWQLAMQNKDGGWGAFDRECNKELLTYIPFADHNAMIDPSTADVSGRTVVALVALLGRDYPAVRRAVGFLEREQEADGSWYGRWGSNYIYGTWLALCGLAAAGKSPSSVKRGVDWLLRVQNEDGGWGETLESYVDPRQKGCGPSTAAQTAWAMMGVLAVYGDRLSDTAPSPSPGVLAVSSALERAADWLLGAQSSAGGWYDLCWTGTGFPAVFYLRYHYYDRYFPLEALAAYQNAVEVPRSSSS